MELSSFKFLLGFFANCPTDQYIELFYIEPIDKRLASEFVRIGDWDHLKAALGRAQTWNDKGYGVFFGVCPRTSDLTIPGQTARGGEADVNTITGFWTEIDSVKEGRDPQADLAAIQVSDTPPSLCVLSGGGVHAYWLFNQPCAMPSDDRPVIKAALKGLGKTVGGDPSVAEFARILRIPGFINTKPGRDSAPVNAVVPERKRRYTLEYLLKFKPAETPRPIIYRPPVDQSQQDVVDLANRALDALSSSRRDNYAEWVEIGMSLAELGSTGLSLWESWSAGSSKYKAGECVRKWDTFKPRQGHTIGYLFFCADLDAGKSWRPIREMPRYAEKLKIIEKVQAEDAQYPNGLPVAVRGAVNAYAPASAGPLLELIVEATAQNIIPRGSPISVECLKYAAVRTGREVSIHTIRAGLKAGTDRHGVEFLRILSHYNNTIPIDSGNTDQSDKILINPCRCPGRQPILYELLPWSDILANIARAAVAPIIQKVFPADQPLVAPIRADCLAGLGRVDIETLADELDARYGALVASQPGYKKAMNRANTEFQKLARELANPQSAPIPDDWTYRNSSEYLSCCERAIIEAAGGETQYGRRKNAALIGCSERNLAAVYRGAGVAVEKDQLADVTITAPEQLRQAIEKPWHDDLQGYAIAFVSSRSPRAKAIEDTDALEWSLGQIEIGAVVSVRYRQANKQTVVTAEQPQKAKPEAKLEVEEAARDELQPRLLEVEPPAPPTVAQRWAKILRRIACIIVYAENRVLGWAEANVAKLVGLATPVKVRKAVAMDGETGEVKLFDVQLSMDMLLGKEPKAEPPRLGWEDDPVVSWVVSELGGKVTAVERTEAQPSLLERAA